MAVEAGCSITCVPHAQLQPRGVVRGVLGVIIIEFALTLVRYLTYTMTGRLRQSMTAKEDGLSIGKYPLKEGSKVRARHLVVILLVSSLVVCFSSVGGAAKNPDLIFYMSFDNASGDEIEDDSGNGSTGFLNGDAELTADGKFGSALSLGGAGHVDCGNADILNQDFPGLTIEAWVYPTALGGIQAPAAKWAWTVQGDHFGLFLSEDKPLVAVADGVTSENGLTATGAINENEWTHVAVTWDSQSFNQQVYINGKLDSEGRQNGSGININSAETLKIGAQITGIPRYFIGLIDEVAVYGRALTEGEIKIDMQGMAPVQPSGKVSTTWVEIKIQ